MIEKICPRESGFKLTFTPRTTEVMPIFKITIKLLHKSRIARLVKPHEKLPTKMNKKSVYFNIIRICKRGRDGLTKNYVPVDEGVLEALLCLIGGEPLCTRRRSSKGRPALNGLALGRHETKPRREKKIEEEGEEEKAAGVRGSS